MSPSKLNELVVKAEDIPSLSPLFNQIDSALRDPQSNAQSIADLISKDISISAKILRVVNSPIFGLRERIHSISRAVAILGTKEVSRIVMAISVVNAFEDEKYKHVDFNNFWLHSIAVSVAAKAIAKKAPKGLLKDPELVFIGGLIHDIGKLVLWTAFPQQHNDIVKYASDKGCSMHQAEMELLSMDHQSVGALVAENWRLPESLQLLIKYHNTPQDIDNQDPYFPLISVIHIADLIVKAMDIGWSGDELVPRLYPPSADILKLSMDDLEEITQDLTIEAFKLSKLIFN